jgi:hypothetical protein
MIKYYMLMSREKEGVSPNIYKLCETTEKL